MTDPIDRALERFNPYGDEKDWPDAPKVRTILTDFAAESRKGEELLKLEYLRYWDAERVAREKAEARLAAVVEILDQDIEEHGTVFSLVLKLNRALARGEGGEQVSAAQGDNLTSPAISQPGEPAAPDAPQITMHALDLDHLRGECRECGREPEHPCHGGSWGYDPTRGR